MRVTNIGKGLNHYDTLIRGGADRSQIAERLDNSEEWSPVSGSIGWLSQFALIDQRTDYDIMREALESILHSPSRTEAQCVAQQALNSLTGDSGCDKALRENVQNALTMLSNPLSNLDAVRMCLKSALEDE